jgi:putative endonuclease
MSKNRVTGQLGEKMAADFLSCKGYSIEYVNWKGEGCEIDIIARQQMKWIFIEVKTRSHSRFGWPEKAVNKTKQRHIAKAADKFIFDYQIEDEIRFDIISIIKSGDKVEIYHIEDAFVP